jgi:hypothetical protein
LTVRGTPGDGRIVVPFRYEVVPVHGRIGVPVDGKAKILEAHVQFELRRWRRDAAATVLEEQVDGVFAWLDSVTPAELTTPDRVTGWLHDLLADLPPSEGLMGAVEQAVRTAHESLLAEPAELGELVNRDHYEQVVSAVIGMTELRQEIMEQITTSTVYAGLLSHVLYHGIKDYLLTQNLFVRKVPGASSLMRMGQNAIRSATPNLEKGIDKQLLDFVRANIQDTLRESRRFLDEILDDEMLWTVADEVWGTNAAKRTDDAAGLIDSPTVDDLVGTLWDAWVHLRESQPFQRLYAAVVQGFFDVHGDTPVGVLIGELGLTRQLALRHGGPPPRPAGRLLHRVLRRHPCRVLTGYSVWPTGSTRIPRWAAIAGARSSTCPGSTTAPASRSNPRARSSRDPRRSTRTRVAPVRSSRSITQSRKVTSDSFAVPRSRWRTVQSSNTTSRRTAERRFRLSSRQRSSRTRRSWPPYHSHPERALPSTVVSSQFERTSDVPVNRTPVSRLPRQALRSPRPAAKATDRNVQSTNRQPSSSGSSTASCSKDSCSKRAPARNGSGDIRTPCHAPPSAVRGLVLPPSPA